MADSRYNRMNNQAPAQAQLEASKPNVGRSAFDSSCIHSGNTMYGLVAPVDCFDFVPNEDIDIDISALVELRNPLLRNILNGSRVYFHCYVNYLVDLWEGAKNFLDAGRSGKISLNRPNLIYHVSYLDPDEESDTSRTINANTPLSLLNFLGLPAEYMHGSNQVSPLRSFQACVAMYGRTSTTAVRLAYSPDFFPADCAFAYQRNWRDYYSNPNLLQNNKAWFPDNEDHFILSYSCENAVAIRYEDEDFASEGNPDFASVVNLLGKTVVSYDNVTPEPNNPMTSVPENNIISAPNLSGIKFRQFKGDRFTTALPFPDLIRGDIPVLADTGDFNFLQSLSDDGVLGIVHYGITHDGEYPEDDYPIYVF